MEKEEKQKKATWKETRFIDLYLKDFKAKQAAEGAGYSAKTASAIAWQMLQRPHVKAEIERRIELFAVGRHERLMLLSEIARDKDAKDGDRISAIEKMGKLAGDYTDKVEHSGNLKMNIVDIDYGLNGSSD